MISIRELKATDKDLLFEWSNDPLTRANSFQTDSISFEEHDNWFEQQLLKSHMNYILECDTIPMGLVRFSDKENTTIIGIVIAPAFRGKKLGSVAISMGCEQFLSKHPNANIFAYIKTDNISSIKSFEKANFERTKKLDINGYSSLEMQLRK